jgi:ATP-dependent DNA helicase RecG
VGAPVAREGPVTVTELAEQLRAGALACKVVEVLHGRVPGEQRDEIMERFRAGRVHALVATTVIEVGVDVPNATVMVVEDADRFGLATLHQLRGRVGRGGKGGVCVLIARAKTEQANARLHVMTSTGDGFELAQKDIEIRGFGDVIGVRQSGMPPFKVADLSKDLDLLTLARRDAAAWIAASPELGRAEDALARSRLLKAHGKWLGLADVG